MNLTFCLNGGKLQTWLELWQEAVPQLRVLCHVWQRAFPGGSLSCSMPINPSCLEGHRKGFVKVLEPTSWSNFELPAGARKRSRALVWCSVYHLILLGGKLLQAGPVTAFMWLSTSSPIKVNYIWVAFFTWPYLAPLLHLPFWWWNICYSDASLHYYYYIR